MCRSPSARSVMSIRLWRLSCSSIWSRKPMPVLMSYWPVPSILIAAAMRVSLVMRATKARRPPEPGVVSSWLVLGVTGLIEPFFPWLFIGAIHRGFHGVFLAKAGGTVERHPGQDDAQKHDQAAQNAGRGQRIAEKQRGQGHRGDRDQVHVDHHPADPEPLEAEAEAHESHAHRENGGVEPVAPLLAAQPPELA